MYEIKQQQKEDDAGQFRDWWILWSFENILQEALKNRLSFIVEGEKKTALSLHKLTVGLVWVQSYLFTYACASLNSVQDKHIQFKSLRTELSIQGLTDNPIRITVFRSGQLLVLWQGEERGMQHMCSISLRSAPVFVCYSESMSWDKWEKQDIPCWMLLHLSSTFCVCQTKQFEMNVM